MLRVTVKWNAQKFENIDLDTSQPPLLFKTQLFSLTNVPVDRQKIIIKGSSLKDDADLSKLNLKQGQTIMLMGTAEQLPNPPPKQSVFLEDMDDSELAKAMQVPSGLANLGNTCYMSATLQCLRTIPELQTALDNSKLTTTPSDPSRNLVLGLRDLFRLLKNSSETVHPLVFVQLLRQVFPRFGESNANGFLQQDAEECWGELVSVLRNNLDGLDEHNQLTAQGKKFIEQYMMGEMTSTMKSSEAPDEQPTISVEPFTKLNINIGAGVSTYMISDLTNGLVETLTKNSPTLNRSLTYTKTSRITRLPYYLVTSFVRFQWKPAESVKAKILKRVKFPFELDMFGVCSTELQEKLKVGRARIKELDDKKAELKKSKKNAQEPTTTTATSTTTTQLTTTHAARTNLYKTLGIPTTLIDDVGANVSGQYELSAVLTHVGRTAESGHYIAWTKNERGEWWKFDDEKTSMIRQEDISKLEGGGDWHTAYICLYKSRSLDG